MNATAPAPSPAQARLIAAIIEHGGTNVPGTALFGTQEQRRAIKTATIDSCLTAGWVTRTVDAEGTVRWSVTADPRPPTPDADAAPVLDADGLPVDTAGMDAPSTCSGCSSPAASAPTAAATTCTPANAGPA